MLFHIDLYIVSPTFLFLIPESFKKGWISNFIFFWNGNKRSFKYFLFYFETLCPLFSLHLLPQCIVYISKTLSATECITLSTEHGADPPPSICIIFTHIQLGQVYTYILWLKNTPIKYVDRSVGLTSNSSFLLIMTFCDVDSFIATWVRECTST